LSEAALIVLNILADFRRVRDEIRAFVNGLPDNLTVVNP